MGWLTDWRWARVQEEWSKIPQDVVLKPIDSMPKRVDAIIRAGGGHTRY